jgi:dephospho-CoA kinase
VGGRDREAPPFIGLPGGMAAGKSEALAALERLGAATLSTDSVVHELLSTEEVRVRVVERLGADVVTEGELDRAAVAEAVFDRAEDREWLEGLLWPRVGQRIAEWRQGLAASETRPAAAVVEVPLLFESGMEAAFDATIAVVADDAVRARRAEERGHHGLESRSSRQLDQREKAERADFTVRNDGELTELEARLRDVLATIGS